MNEKSSHAAKGWTVVIAGLSINLILGVLYAWGVVAKALETNWHWSKTDATRPFSVATVCFAGDDGLCGAMPGQIRPAARRHRGRHHAGPRPARFRAGSFALRDDADLWGRRRVGDWPGLLRDDPARDQMVSARAQGHDHRDCGQRRGLGGGLYRSAHPVPSGRAANNSTRRPSHCFRSPNRFWGEPPFRHHLSGSASAH